MKKISIFLISTTLFSLASLGQNPPLPTMPPEETGAEQMNGIVFKNYIGFEKKYKLVTVRYRTDSGEQRFVYANDIAFKALQKGSTNYPDGAVFAKIGVATKDDPAFLSSKVPGGPQRIQLMVRNKKKYKETGGWGYALFSPRGHTFSNDLQVETKACYACHQLVPDRGQVFSQSFNLST
ncbi:MAG: cytochrome P460 family protein, partial [Pseudobdellovibrionaceae bacterium]